MLVHLLYNNCLCIVIVLIFLAHMEHFFLLYSSTLSPSVFLFSPLVLLSASSYPQWLGFPQGGFVSLLLLFSSLAPSTTPTITF